METRRSFLKVGLGAGLGAVILPRCGGADVVAAGAAADGGTGSDSSGTSDGGTAATDGGTTAGCVLDPTTTKGPYWVDERLNRSDVRADTNGIASPNPRPGLPLTLEFAVSAYASGVCTPLQSEQVDIWHCDASGIYSDVQG